MGDGTSAAHGGDEHHEPAVDDWPAGIGETSVWPLVTALGVTVVYVGAALVAMSYGDDAVIPRWPGVGTFLAGFGGFLVGLLGWLYHGFVRRYWTRGSDQHDGLTLRTAMVLFLVTEVATFAAGFAYYFYVRVRPWPPEHIPHLLGSLVLVNTALLVASSVTLHVAHHALQEGNRERFERLTGVTLLLGVVFLFGQVYEYYEFVVVEGYTLASGVFASAFFGLTGLHGLHVTLGAVLLTIIFVRAWRLGQYSPSRMTSVSTVTMYWHYVDAVWLFLVTVLYVGGSIGTP